MRPAYSVVLLTTLIGAGQGLFLALYAVDAAAALGWTRAPARDFFVTGAAMSLALSGLGLLASFFHLGRPERAWRSAAMWRTSWLSREVIALPLFMASATAWGAAHWLGWPAATALGAFALAACLALYWCTAMIYACIKFLQEWASPITVANFFAMGAASGFTLAVPLAALFVPHLAAPLGAAAIGLTLLALATRLASLARNASIRPRSTPQSAIGVQAPKVVQKSMGFMGGSFNTREFFHGMTAARMRAIRTAFLLLAFAAPPAVLAAGLANGSVPTLAAAFAIQYSGLLLERWYFLAQANHPQNLYYQCIA